MWRTSKAGGARGTADLLTTGTWPTHTARGPWEQLVLTGKGGPGPAGWRRCGYQPAGTGGRVRDPTAERLLRSRILPVVGATWRSRCALVFSGRRSAQKARRT